MKKYKPMGYELQVGDRIEVSMVTTPIRIDTVTRVTKTLAICEGKGVVKYPRVVGLAFHAKPYQRSTITYRVLDV